MTRLDRELREAFSVLETTTEAGYFDNFPNRLQKTLETCEMGTPETIQNDVDGFRPLPPVADNRGQTSAPAAAVAEENSGLHDIKALAESAKRRISRRRNTQSQVEQSLLNSSTTGLAAVVLPQTDATPTYEDKPAATVSAVVADAADSEERAGLPVWIYGAIAIVAIGAVAFYVLRGGSNEPDIVATQASSPAVDRVVAPQPSTPQVKAPAPATKDPASGSDVVAGSASANEPKDPSLVSDKPQDTRADKRASADKAADRPRKKRRAERERRDTERRAVVKADKAAASGAEPAASVVAKPDKQRSLNELLAEATGKPLDTNKTGAKNTAAKPKAPTKTKLTRSEINAGMRSVLGRVHGCFAKFKVPGTVMVRISIQPSGAVSASTTGKFKGTPTGRCVSSAARKARFPAYQGRPTSFTYPFLLSP